MTFARRVGLAALVHVLFAPATAHLKRLPESICGRRTLFDYRGGLILVNELFLPAIPEFRH